MTDKCKNKKCGCQDTMLTTPAPCPTPIGCLDPEPCGEVFNAQCILYTGENILCGTDVVVVQNQNVSEALASIVEYFCAFGNDLVLQNDLYCPESPVIAPAGTPVNEALELLTQYICTGLPIAAVVSGDGITVTDNTVGNVTTYTVSSAVTLTNTGTGEQIANDSVGPDFTLRSLVAGPGIALNTTADEIEISATGGGVIAWQPISISQFGGTATVNLVANSRIVYTISGASDVNFITPAVPPFGTEIEFVFRGSCEFRIQPGLPSSNTSVEVWSAAGPVTATSGGNTKLEWNTLTAETYGTHIRLLCIQNSGGGIVWWVIEQTWNDQPVVIV